MNVAIRPKYISLFAGAGGLELAVRLALPAAQCVCYVEREVEAAGILAARIRDQALDDAPIWSDVCTFDGKPWRGLVVGIVGGFPCTDLSVAGKREGIKRGNQSGLFYEYARIIREVEPRWVYIENVPAVLAFPAGGIVLGELAKLGFDAEWGTLRASDVGASHKRRRCFVLAYRRGSGRQQILGSAFGYEGKDEGRRENSGYVPSGVCHELAYPDGERRGEARGVRCGADGLSDGPSADVEYAECPEWWQDSNAGTGNQSRANREGQASSGTGERSLNLVNADFSDDDRRGISGEGWRSKPANTGTELGNSDESGLEGRRLLTSERGDERLAGLAGSGMVFAPGPADPIWNDLLVWHPEMRPALSQAEVESFICRDVDGLASPLHQRIDRLRACGNGVVPVQGAAAFRELVRRISTR